MNPVSGIAQHFHLSGPVISHGEISNGLINSTYRITCLDEESTRDYILQKINTQVFTNAHLLMGNVEVVTAHLAEQADTGQSLQLIPTKQDRRSLITDDGSLWRCYNAITNATTYDVVESPDLAYQAAKAFGSFVAKLADLSPSQLAETIPDFHNTPQRYTALETAISSDSHNRVAESQAEIDFIRARIADIHALEDLKNAGKLPLRIVHNDTKINNVMIDAHSGEAVCVIDLDTVMPGLSLHDFGDLVRTASPPTAEDERDLSRVKMRLPYFESIVRGYLEGTAGKLTSSEIDQLAFAPRSITLEIAIRFLTDHLQGDVYFRTDRPNQNLERAKAQLTLLDSMEKQYEEMEQIVRNFSS